MPWNEETTPDGWPLRRSGGAAFATAPSTSSLTGSSLTPASAPPTYANAQSPVGKLPHRALTCYFTVVRHSPVLDQALSGRKANPCSPEDRGHTERSWSGRMTDGWHCAPSDAQGDPEREHAALFRLPPGPARRPCRAPGSTASELACTRSVRPASEWPCDLVGPSEPSCGSAAVEPAVVWCLVDEVVPADRCRGPGRGGAQYQGRHPWQGVPPLGVHTARDSGVMALPEPQELLNASRSRISLNPLPS